MTTTAATPFAARVDDAIRQAQTVLALSPDGLAPDAVSGLNEQLRRFREEVVEPEAARAVTAERPIALAMSVAEAEVHAAICGAASRGPVTVAPSPVQAAALGVISLRLRSQVDQHAARPVAVPPAADAALANGPEGAA